MNVTKSSLLVTGFLQAVGLSLAFLMTGSPLGRVVGLGLALGIPLLLLGMPRRSGRVEPGSCAEETLPDVRCFVPGKGRPASTSPESSARVASEVPPAALPSEAARSESPRA